MKTFIVMVAAALVLGCVGVQTQSQPLVFTHVTLIDATGTPAKPEMTVVVTAGHIVAVGRTGKVRVPDGAEVVDAVGKFMIPGLWDMHVHLGNYADGKKTLAALAAYGITGVRDMASSPDDV